MEDNEIRAKYEKLAAFLNENNVTMEGGEYLCYTDDNSPWYVVLDLDTDRWEVSRDE